MPTAKNFRSGVGCALDQEREGLRTILRTFNTGTPVETARRPLAPGTMVRAFRQGSLVSLTPRGEIQAFDENLPFAGLVIKLYEDRGGIIVATHSRGAICAHLDGMTLDTKLGAAVHAASAEGAFNVHGRGALVGILLAPENVEKSFAIIGFKEPNDARPLALAGTGFDSQSAVRER